MKKKDPEIFEPFKNPTFDYINHNQEKIRARISCNPANEFIIDFVYKAKEYSLKLPPITSKEKLFSSDEIDFIGIELHSIEKEKISRRLNEILNFKFD